MKVDKSHAKKPKRTFPVSSEQTILYRIKNYNESTTRVIRALKILGKATAEEIRIHLRKETKDNNLMHTIEIRTIQRKLKYLKKEDVVKRLKFDQYILTEKATSDIRYYPQEFRDLALSSLIYYIGNIKSYQQTLDELVGTFGAYVVYCFIEALKSTIPSDSQLTLYWLEDALSPFKMYSSFLSAFGHNKNKLDSPSFDNQSIERLSNALQNKYPLQYEQLLKSKANCLKATPSKDNEAK